MNKRTLTSLTASTLALAFALTACSSDSSNEPSSSPSASVTAAPTPSESTDTEATPAPEETSEEAVAPEEFKVTLDEVVTATYPDTAASLPGTGEALMELTQEQIKALQFAREGDEIDFYEPLHLVMTDNAWAQIEYALASNDPLERARAINFVPQALPNGIYDIGDGVEYKSLDSTQGITSTPISDATVALSDDGEAVVWSQNTRISAQSDKGEIVFDRTVKLRLVSGTDGMWKIDDWFATAPLDGIDIVK